MRGEPACLLGREDCPRSSPPAPVRLDHDARSCAKTTLGQGPAPIFHPIGPIPALWQLRTLGAGYSPTATGDVGLTWSDPHATRSRTTLVTSRVARLRRGEQT